MRSMYEAINDGDHGKAKELLADGVLYEDLNFAHAFSGREAVGELFRESVESCPDGMRFIIDDATGDDTAVGISWHVELDGIFFPNTRGASFYKVDEDGKLVYARDIVENPVKLGSVAFALLRLLTPLVRLTLRPADAGAAGASGEAPRRRGPGLEGYLYYGLAATYVYVLLLSPNGQLIPGDAAWQIQREQLDEVIGCSSDFFFLLSGLNKLGVGMSAAELHPVTKGLFNFAEAQIFMFLPVLLRDVRMRRAKGRADIVKMWTGAMFLTNVFLLPLMAMRASVDPEPAGAGPSAGNTAADRAVGLTGLGVGAFSLYYALFGGGGEYGSVADRLAFFASQLGQNRITIAFSVDVVLFAYFQVRLLRSAPGPGALPGAVASVPLFGLALSLLL